MKSIEEEHLAHLSGISKKAIRRAILSNQDTLDRVYNFLFGDIGSTILFSVGEDPGSASWSTYGKRCVQILEAREALQFYLRNAIIPENKRVLVLSGPNPDKACMPWIISGLGKRFVAYEKDFDTYLVAKKTLSGQLEKLERKSLPLWGKDFNGVQNILDIDLRWDNCLDENKIEGQFSIIDLDFCNNKLKNPDVLLTINNIINKSANRKGITIFRTTLHVGRTGNSWKEVEKNIEDLEKLLRWTSFRIRHKSEHRYLSTLPMVSVMWILERRDKNENGRRFD